MQTEIIIEVLIGNQLFKEEKIFLSRIDQEGRGGLGMCVCVCFPVWP